MAITIIDMPTGEIEYSEPDNKPDEEGRPEEKQRIPTQYPETELEIVPVTDKAEEAEDSEDDALPTPFNQHNYDAVIGSLIKNRRGNLQN